MLFSLEPDATKGIIRKKEVQNGNGPSIFDEA